MVLSRMGCRRLCEMTVSEQAKLLLCVALLKFPKFPNYYFPVFMLLKYIKINRLKKKFKIVKVPAELIQLKMEEDKDHLFDINSCIVLNKVHHRTILNGSCFVELRNEENKTKIVQVIPSSCVELDGNEILVSDNANISFDYCTISEVNLNSIPIATEVNLSLVSSEQGLTNAMVNIVLKNYFQNPKIINKNDLITIDTRNYAAEIFYTNIKVNGTSCILFKCNQIKNSQQSDSLICNLCIYGVTSLVQSTAIQSMLPKRIELVVKKCQEESYYKDLLLPICPYGLEKYVNQLSCAIRPFLHQGKLPLNPVFLIKGPKGSGKHVLINALGSQLGLKFYKPTKNDMNAQAYAQTEIRMKNVFFKSKMCAPCILVIENIEELCKNNEGNFDSRIVNHFKNELNSLFKENDHIVIVICISSCDEIHPEISRIFLEIVNLTCPDRECRGNILKWLVNSEFHCDPDIIASKTNGFFYEDLKALVNYAKNLAQSVGRSDLKKEDFEKSLDLMQNNYVETLGAPKIPKVKWSDVGGLNGVKEEIIKTVNVPLKHPELLKLGLRRSGILLYGPPGTGKTLMAKAVATECALCFLSVKGPELLNMYVGQSEQNVREVFEKARQASPCIIFFDELDSLAPNRGNSGDSGGVMDRVVSQLLSEMDGLDDSTTVFIIGATNRPDLIDPALLRPGRLDKLLYVGPCVDIESKVLVMQALTKRFNLSDKFSMEKLLKLCPDNITGADLYGICSNAWMNAASRAIKKIEKTAKGKLALHGTGTTEKDIIVTGKDFEEAIKLAKPSVSQTDMVYFEKVRKEYK